MAGARTSPICSSNNGSPRILVQADPEIRSEVLLLLASDRETVAPVHGAVRDVAPAPVRFLEASGGQSCTRFPAVQAPERRPQRGSPPTPQFFRSCSARVSV
jgi:hypothetical protein